MSVHLGFVTQMNNSNNQLWEVEEIAQWVKCLLRGMGAEFQPLGPMQRSWDVAASNSYLSPGSRDRGSQVFLASQSSQKDGLCL